MKKTVLLGATGFVGSHVLEGLIKNERYGEITIYTRKQIEGLPAKVKQVVTDFVDMEAIELPENVDSLFSCLGTTRKKTPDLKAYRKIEVEIPRFFLSKLKPRGLQTCHFISSIGANKDSKNYYLKLKGEAEQEFKDSSIPSIYIYQPGFLMGKRPNASLTEKITLKFARLLDVFCVGSGEKYHSVNVKNLAESMIVFDKNSVKGTHVLTYTQFKKNNNK